MHDQIRRLLEKKAEIAAPIHEVVTDHLGRDRPHKTNSGRISLMIAGGMQHLTGMEAALNEDLARIETDEDGTIDIILRTEEGVFEVSVSRADSVTEAISCALDTGTRKLEILLDGVDISEGSFEDAGIESGARITVVRPQTIRTREEVMSLIDEIITCNPAADKANMLRGAEFDSDGFLQNWDLSDNQLSSLPESFGNLQVGGNLDLYNNQLSSLPESFGNLQVGGALYLGINQLSSLPELFGNLQVDGDLNLSENQLSSLPESFGNLQVGEALALHNNQLSSLPESFGNLQVGGYLYLQDNPIAAQRPSFPGLKINF